MPRKRFNSRRLRKVKLFLLTLGSCGLLIGAGLAWKGWERHNRRLMVVSLIYLLASAGLLAARQALVGIEEARRRRRVHVA